MPQRGLPSTDRAALGLPATSNGTGTAERLLAIAEAGAGAGHVATEETQELGMFQALAVVFSQVVILDIVLASIATAAAMITAGVHGEDVAEAGADTASNVLIEGFFILTFFLITELLIGQAERNSKFYQENIANNAKARLLINVLIKAPTLVFDGDMGGGLGQNIVKHIPPYTAPMSFPQLVISLSPGFLMALSGQMLVEFLFELTGKQPKDFGLKEHLLAGGTANICLFIGNGLITFYTGAPLVSTLAMSAAFSGVLSAKRYLDANQTLPKLLFGNDKAVATGTAAAVADTGMSFQRLDEGDSSAASRHGCISAIFAAFSRTPKPTTTLSSTPTSAGASA